ncbi:MAG: hypothetical protein P1V20_17750 [Verrucomicrobiales bacterium]|nr:hypothetical protein [Verrucomicrobiales bacterium]
MRGWVRKQIRNLENVKAVLAVKMEKFMHAAEEIVDEGAEAVHHDVPAKSRMLPFPIGHCPLSVQPLYPPPSIEREERVKLLAIGQEVFRCFHSGVNKVSNRSVKELEEFAHADKEEG